MDTTEVAQHACFPSVHAELILQDLPSSSTTSCLQSSFNTIVFVFALFPLSIWTINFPKTISPFFFFFFKYLFIFGCAGISWLRVGFL